MDVPRKAKGCPGDLEHQFLREKWEMRGIFVIRF